MQFNFQWSTIYLLYGILYSEICFDCAALIIRALENCKAITKKVKGNAILPYQKCFLYTCSIWNAFNCKQKRRERRPTMREAEAFSLSSLSACIQIEAGRQWGKGIVLWIASLTPFHSQANPQPSSFCVVRGGRCTHNSDFFSHFFNSFFVASICNNTSTWKRNSCIQVVTVSRVSLWGLCGSEFTVSQTVFDQNAAHHSLDWVQSFLYNFGVLLPDCSTEERDITGPRALEAPPPFQSKSVKKTPSVDMLTVSGSQKLRQESASFKLSSATQGILFFFLNKDLYIFIQPKYW